MKKKINLLFILIMGSGVFLTACNFKVISLTPSSGRGGSDGALQCFQSRYTKNAAAELSCYAAGSTTKNSVDTPTIFFQNTVPNTGNKNICGNRQRFACPFSFNKLLFSISPGGMPSNYDDTKNSSFAAISCQNAQSNDFTSVGDSIIHLPNFCIAVGDYTNTKVPAERVPLITFFRPKGIPSDPSTGNTAFSIDSKSISHNRTSTFPVTLSGTTAFSPSLSKLTHLSPKANTVRLLNIGYLYLPNKSKSNPVIIVVGYYIATSDVLDTPDVKLPFIAYSTNDGVTFTISETLLKNLRVAHINMFGRGFQNFGNDIIYSFLCNEKSSCKLYGTFQTQGQGGPKGDVIQYEQVISYNSNRKEFLLGSVKAFPAPTNGTGAALTDIDFVSTDESGTPTNLFYTSDLNKKSTSTPQLYYSLFNGVESLTGVTINQNNNTPGSALSLSCFRAGAEGRTDHQNYCYAVGNYSESLKSPFFTLGFTSSLAEFKIPNPFDNIYGHTDIGLTDKDHFGSSFFRE